MFALLIFLGVVKPINIYGSASPSSYNKLSTACSGSPCGVLTAAQAISAPYQNIGSEVNIAADDGNGYRAQQLQISGVTNPWQHLYMGFYSNGGASSWGDYASIEYVQDAHNGYGGHWGPLYLQGNGGSVHVGPDSGGNNSLCLNGECITSFPELIGGVYFNNKCDGNNNIYTLTSSQRFPHQIDAALGANSGGNGGITNENVTIGPTNNNNTQQLRFWDGVGSCSGSGTFYAVVLGH